jgi:hypothetical protein
VDPLSFLTNEVTPYHYVSNNPILKIDFNGEAEITKSPTGSLKNELKREPHADRVYANVILMAGLHQIYEERGSQKVLVTELKVEQKVAESTMFVLRQGDGKEYYIIDEGQKYFKTTDLTTGKITITPSNPVVEFTEVYVGEVVNPGGAHGKAAVRFDDSRNDLIRVRDGGKYTFAPQDIIIPNERPSFFEDPIYWFRKAILRMGDTYEKSVPTGHGVKG